MTDAQVAARFHSLDDETRRAYRILGALPVPVLDADLAAAACSLPWGEADWLLQILQEEQLIEHTAPWPDVEVRSPAYRFEDGARSLARELSTGEEVPALERLGEWFATCARATQQYLAPHQAELAHHRPCGQQGGAGFQLPFPRDDGSAMLEWLARQSAGNLRPVLSALQDQGRNDLIWRTVDSWWPQFQRRRPYELWAAAHRAGLEAACADGHRGGKQRMLLSGAIGLLGSGQYQQATAWNEAALECARDDGDERDEGHALYGLALVHLAEHRADDAVAFLAQAMARWESCGYRRGKALAQIALAQSTLHDRPEHAIDLLTCARTELRAHRDTHHAGRALALRGHAHLLTGNPAAAVADLKQARDEFPEDDVSLWPDRTRTLLSQARAALRGQPNNAGGPEGDGL
jgi:tetratricopeptide (TPR) repeat protein